MTTDVLSPIKPQNYTSIIQWLIPLWEKLLEVQDIDAESDFFDLGADSLTVIRLLHRIEQTFGQNVISLDTLFEQSQLHQVAKVIERSLIVG